MSSAHGASRRAIIRILTCSASFAWLISSAASAAPAISSPFQDMQPDGTVIALRIRGDEHLNWTEDLDGYTVIREKGWYEYARLNPQGRLVPTGLRVGHHSPDSNGLAKGVLPSGAHGAPSADGSADNSGEAVPGFTEASGTVRNLVVLVQFDNHAGRALPSSTEVDLLFNALGGDALLAPTGSVRDYYLHNSYGQLDLISDISSWITVSGSESYYANGKSGFNDVTIWEALTEALDQLDAAVDFSQYDANNDGYVDAMGFLHSGYAAEWGGSDEDGTLYTSRIWSHAWSMDPAWVSEEGVRVSTYQISPALWRTSGSEIGRISTIVHETGHIFGLPDLYDTDGGGRGIGGYGLMGYSWGFGNTGQCPPHLSPWSKLQLGWIHPVHISQPGEYSIGQSFDNNDFFAISAGYSSNEYLLIENRQRVGFECWLPQGGLAIWHVDDQTGFDTEGYPSKRWPRNGEHYRVALAQADGGFNLERGNNPGDAYDMHRAGWVDAMAPGPDGHPNTDGYQDGRITYTGHIISNISESGPIMTFCLNGCGNDGGGDPGDPTPGFDAPSDLSATVSMSGNGKNASKVVQLTWADNSAGVENEEVFIVERCEESGNGKSKSCNFSAHATVGQDVNSFSESAGSGSFMYRVKARNSTGDETAYSNEVKI